MMLASQIQFLDSEAMAMAICACWMKPLACLNRNRPPQHISGKYDLALLVSMAVCMQLAGLIGMAFMTSRPWYTGGTATSAFVSSPLVRYCHMFWPLLCCSCCDICLLIMHAVWMHMQCNANAMTRSDKVMLLQ